MQSVQVVQYCAPSVKFSCKSQRKTTCVDEYAGHPRFPLPMRTLKTSEAAALLHVSANTLRMWEQRFGYPTPRRSPGKHRLYAYAEVIALREALEEGLSVSSAVSVAREAFGADAHALVAALSFFRPYRADQAMEGSLALRSVERTLEEVLLPALGAIHRRKGLASAAWAYSVAWSTDWLMRARRLAPVGSRRAALLFGDACDPPLDPAVPYRLALELCCARSSIDVLSVPVRASRGISEAVGAIDPDAVVLTGAQATNDEVARWAYQVRGSAGPLPFFLYHRGIDQPNGVAGDQVLAYSPLAAHAKLLEALGTPCTGRVDAASDGDRELAATPPGASGSSSGCFRAMSPAS
jgi:MerR family transcriptional regulator, light-induced transcriptional regulator